MSHKIFSSISPMKTLLLSATALALLAGPAAAAELSCQTMIQSFDRAAAASGGAAKVIAKAKKLRNVGAAELAKGNEKACLAQLKLAQTSIGSGNQFDPTSQPSKIQIEDAPGRKS